MKWWGSSRTQWGDYFVVCSSKGICEAGFIDHDSRFLELQSFHNERDDNRAAILTNTIFLSAQEEISLDLHGSLFQQRVWNGLMKLSWGERVTYGELAQKLGLPGAARAVANAVARNPIAVIIPCHRVIPARGGVGEYRWGAGRKAELLEREHPPNS